MSGIVYKTNGVNDDRTERYTFILSASETPNRHVFIC